MTWDAINTLLSLVLLVLGFRLTRHKKEAGDDYIAEVGGVSFDDYCCCAWNYLGHWLVGVMTKLTDTEKRVRSYDVG